MSVFDRQFKAVLSQELLRYLLQGRLPNLDEISKKVSDVLGKDGKITYQYISQPSRSVFQVKTYNQALRRIKFDIDIFQEELLELFQEVNKRISYADLYHKVNSYELNRLKSELESVLFTIENADFYFLGAHDNFLDSSRIDSSKSTSGILDLSERCLSIPIGKSATKKIKTSHLHSYSSWPIEVISPSSLDVISSRIVPGTAFSNIFIDTVSAWAFEVKSRTQGRGEIKFTFPLAGAAAEEVEVLINRIEILAHASGQQAKVRISTDNINYLAPSGYEEGLKLESLDTTYSLDFETNLAQYLEVTLSKDSPDAELLEQGTKVYQYIFGLKSIAAYTTGRGLSATYISKPFDFSDQDGKISKVSIKSDFIRPPGTSVSYSIALDKGAETSFHPINPLGKPTRNGLPEIVTFSEIESYSRKFNSDITGTNSAQQYGSPFQGKTFYRIGPALAPDPVFGTVKLFRGFRQWYRDRSTSFEVVDNTDVFIDFSISNTEAIYSTTKEVPSYQNRIDPVSGYRTVVLTTAKLPYYDSSKGHAIKSPLGIDPSTDSRPNYAIYKVLQTSNVARRSDQFTLGSALSFNLPVANFIVQSLTSSDLPELRSDNTVYRNGIDYTIDLDGSSGKPSGRMDIPNGSSLLNAAGSIAVPDLQLTFTCKPDPDITHKVLSINGNQITLNNAVVIAGSDSLEITYRYIPIAPNEIIRASIRVSDRSSNSNRRYYIEGTDFSIDSRTGIIQRINSGSIPSGSDVYVNFKHRNSISGIYTFIIWAKIVDELGSRINFDLDPTTNKNKLIADIASGEAFYVNGPGGLVELTKAISTPVLGPGWVQFIVRSKNPDSNVAYGSNLIDQVIQLRNSSKKKIFKEGNIYFDQLTAFREPMIQKTLNHLRVNTLASDHQSFAIDDFTDINNSYVVINFFPTATDEIYTRVPTEDTDEVTRPSADGETFLVTWNSKNQNIDSSSNKIIVRIDLERLPSTDGGLTPKVFGYNLRASI